MSKRHSYPFSLVLFTIGYLLAAGLFALLTDNGEFVFYIVVMVVLIVAITVVHRRCGFSVLLLWGLTGWGLLHMAGGLVTLPESWPYNPPNPVLYSWWIIPERLKYDQVVHAYGFGITTWMCWQALSAGLMARFGKALAPSGGMMVLCAAAGMGFGAFNEVIEFAATVNLPDTNVGGYENTAWDLVYNMLGAAAAGVIIYLRGRRGNF